MGTRQQIVRLLQEQLDCFLSGQEISAKLQISRTAVWKQIEQLRNQGYQIESRHAQGYRLRQTPDLVQPERLQSALKEQIIGHQLHFQARIDSTNLQLRQLAEQGAEEGLVLVADSQSAGRGRLGRSWESPAGVNLYLSILLRPSISPVQSTQLTFLSAVATAEVLQQHCQLAARVKWPNDVVVEGRKIAGMLNELSAETEQLHFLVLGIGLNVNMHRQQLPQKLRYPATSVLIETGNNWNREQLLEALLRRSNQLYLEYLQQGFEPLRRRWQSLCDLIDKPVEVDLGQRKLQGIAGALEADGALKLFLPDGSSERILAGDVRPLA